MKTLMLIATLFIGSDLLAQNKERPSNVKYGSHERNGLDIFFADTTKVTPLAIYIHGGGFVNGSKDGLGSNVIIELLDAGNSVAAINYRFITIAPLPAAHHDALRALQFIRQMQRQGKSIKRRSEHLVALLGHNCACGWHSVMKWPTRMPKTR